MADEDIKARKNLPSDYTFKASSPAEDYLAIASIHHREAKQLLENAQAAQAEDRQEEAKLLMDLAVERRKTAEEFEKAAKGEASDPIVDEILDWQEDLCEGYTPYAPSFFSDEELAAAAAAVAAEAAEQEPSWSRRVNHAWDWVKDKKQQFTRRVLGTCLSILQGSDHPRGSR